MFGYKNSQKMFQPINKCICFLAQNYLKPLNIRFRGVSIFEDRGCMRGVQVKIAHFSDVLEDVDYEFMQLSRIDQNQGRGGY